MTDGGNKAQHEYSEAANLHDGGDGTDAVAPVLNLDNQEGKNQDKWDFYNLIGLKHHGEMGNLNPVPVAITFNPPGGEEHQKKKDAAGQHQLPPLFGEQPEVHKGEQQIGHDAQSNGNGLDNDGAVGVLVAGSGINEGQSEGACGQAQPQQNDVALFPKFLDWGKQQGQQLQWPHLLCKFNHIFYHILLETQTLSVL